jgi:hypothetical protein
MPPENDLKMSPADKTESRLIAGQKVWLEIAKLAEKRKKKAAVAYVGSDSFFRFGEGDKLVVDASDESVMAGSTSARVLERAIRRGANIFSIPRLHAKVMLVGDDAVIGSANISLRSSQLLIESVLVTSERKIVTDIGNWIDALAKDALQVNAEELERLLQIESKRPPLIRSLETLSDIETHLLFFKEVMAGDIEKYERKSNIATSGGGARDLRISPAEVFRPILSGVISEEADAGVTKGTVRSLSGGTIVTETEVELWPPTNARPHELRISRFYEVPGWEVSRAALEQAHLRNERLFYVLERDEHGTITAKIMSDVQMSQSNALIAEHLTRLKGQTAEGRAITGAVDVIKNISVP